MAFSFGNDSGSGRLSTRVLWRSAAFEVVRTRWAADAHPSCGEGHTGVAVAEFMLRGSFEKRIGRSCVVGDPNTVVLFNPGEWFRVAHPRGRENRGVSVRLLPPALAQVCAESTAGRGGHAQPFSHATAGGAAGSFLAVHGLDRALDDPSAAPDPLQVEEVLVRLTAPLAAGGERRASAPAPRSVADARVFARAVEFLNADPGARVTLADVAAASGCSIWRLERLFRRHAGMGVYRYATRLRVRSALGALAADARNLTSVALRAGFGSHSRFSEAFRREFGLPPSAARRALARRELGAF